MGRLYTRAAWVLAIAAAGVLVTAVLPAESLLGLIHTMDPDRTVRPLFAADAGSLRLLLGVWAALLVGLAYAVHRSGPSIGRRLQLAPAQPRAPSTPLPVPDGWEIAALGAVAVLGVGLRVYHLGLPLEGDESHTYVFFASRTLLDAVSDYRTPNNHVFHSVLVWFSTQLFGVHPAAIRAPAFLAGVLAIPLAFFLGRKTRSITLALALAALVAVGPPFVEFSGRARGYTIQLVLLFWCLFASHRALAGRGPTSWAQLAIAAALGMWTSPSFMLPLGGVVLWLVWQRHDRQFLLRLGLALAAGALLTILLYSPVLVRTGWRSLATPASWDPLRPTALLRMGGSEAGLLGRCWSGGIGAAGWPLLALLIAGMLVGLRRGDPWARLVASCLVVYVFLVLARGLKPRARMINWLLPVWFLGASAWTASAGKVLAPHYRRLGAAAIVALAAAWGAAQQFGHVGHQAFFARGHDAENYCANGYYVDSRPVAEAFAEVRTEGDLLVVPPNAGMVSPLRVHMMALGASPASVYQFSPARGPARIGGFSRWYVVAFKRVWDRSARATALADPSLADAGELQRVAAVLGTSVQALDSVVERVAVWRELENTVVFAVDVRPEVTAATERMSERDIMLYGW